MIDRVPPNSLEAEQSVLGAMLLDRQAVLHAEEALHPEDFYRDAHRVVFATICEVFDRGEAVDLVTLTEALRVAGRLDEVGGAAYLTTLADVVPTAANIEHYARIVAEQAARRRLIQAGQELIRLGFADDGEMELPERLGQAEQTVFAVTQRVRTADTVPMGDAVIDRWEYLWQTRNDASVLGLRTGFGDLDAILGGLQPADLILIAARPSMGKTGLGMDLVANVAAAGRTAAVFSLEMSKEQLADRLVCGQAGISSQAVRARTLDQPQWDKAFEQAVKLTNLPIWVNDSPLTTLEIRARARRLKAEQGLDLILIDHLGLEADRHEKHLSKNDFIGGIVRRHKQMAKELRVPVVLLAQLSREVTRRADKRPALEDLRDSGEIEQIADVVIFIHRPEYYDPQDQPGIAELIIAKHRNGPTGMVRLQFNKEFVRFRDLDTRYEAPPEPKERTWKERREQSRRRPYDD